MYAQLGAIAREFNFPSIAGICLYMHVDEAGALFAPRISEESWGILWGHLFESNAPGPTGRLPISGRIEFDIGRFRNRLGPPLSVDTRFVDVVKARWYHSWISVSRRESASLPSLSPTHVASMHQRQESKTTEDGQEQNQTSAVPKTRTGYTPKRLSLLERFDLTNSPPPMPLPIPMPVPVATSSSMPESRPPSPPAKMPVVQEEPHKSHREEIDTRVESWRASATFKTNLLASTGQVSLDPANMPNTLSLGDPVDEDDEIRSEMNLEDYSWSITSAGPPSVLGSLTSTSSHRVPSVHMDKRAVGSVPLTPETCTSWGPEEYDPLSPVSSQFRLPSPDLGQRYLEYCPLTPTTATSWGPPSEYPPSPPLESQWAYYRPPSVDLGRRAEGSRPVTPSTATSWGPPEEWPPTPTTLSTVSTPDAAQQRFSFTEEVGGLVPPPTAMVSPTPAPRNPVWPHLVLDGQQSKPQEQTPWNYVWPYLMLDEQKSRPQEQAPWNYVWPHLMLDQQGSEPQEQTPWNYVWPYLMLDKRESKPQEQAPWSYVRPYLKQETSLPRPQESRKPSVVASRAAYPVFNICGQLVPLVDVWLLTIQTCA